MQTVGQVSRRIRLSVFRGGFQRLGVSQTSIVLCHVQFAMPQQSLSDFQSEGVSQACCRSMAEPVRTPRRNTGRHAGSFDVSGVGIAADFKDFRIAAIGVRQCVPGGLLPQSSPAALTSDTLCQ